MILADLWEGTEGLHFAVDVDAVAVDVDAVAVAASIQKVSQAEVCSKQSAAQTRHSDSPASTCSKTASKQQSQRPEVVRICCSHAWHVCCKDSLKERSDMRTKLSLTHN